MQVTASANPSATPAAKPDEPVEDRPEWSVGVKMGKMPSEELTDDSANTEAAPSLTPASPPPTPTAPKEVEAIDQPDKAMNTAFANLPWYVTEEETFEVLKASGYAPGARESHGGQTLQHFSGNMGTQEIHLHTAFGPDARLQGVTCDILVDPRVQRDLYQAMMKSHDDKYGDENVKMQAGADWSAAWLVHPSTPQEWSVSTQERTEHDGHLVSVYYLAPRLHIAKSQSTPHSS
jgi:hypothetical protein